MPHVCKSDITCENSGEQFSKNTTVLKVQYYDNIGKAVAHDRIFHESDPRIFTIDTRTLRHADIALSPVEQRSGSRALPRFELPEATHDEIVRVIDEVCCDE